MQIDFANQVQKESERTQKELSSQDIMTLFERLYWSEDEAIRLEGYRLQRQAKQDSLEAQLWVRGEIITIQGEGNGALSAFIQALERYFARRISVTNYAEHAMTQATDAQAVAYVQLFVENGLSTGIAYSRDTVSAMLRAALNAVVLAV